MLSMRTTWIGLLLIFMPNVFLGDVLTCSPAEYKIGQQCCPLCPPGKRVHEHCTEYTSTICQPCTEGTFLNEGNGREQCFPCKSCNAGIGLKVKKLCTTSSDAVCGPLEGYYCTDAGENGCVAAQRHRSCEPGQYISQNGTASTDTECVVCTGETYSDGTFTSCQPHQKCESMNRQQIRAGTPSTDSECGEKKIHIIAIGFIIVGLFLLLITVVVCSRGQQITGRTRTEVQRTSEAAASSGSSPQCTALQLDSSRRRL